MEAVANGSVGLFGQDFGYLRGNSARWRRRNETVAQVSEPQQEAVLEPVGSHGLTEEQLRELIARDLRSFVRRPLAAPAGAEASPGRPFLLDRLMGAGF